MASAKLTKSTLIICEGPEDACLLQIMRDNGAIPDCDIKPIGSSGPGKGKDALKAEIISYGLDMGHVRRLIFVMDAEDDNNKSFSDITNAINAANQNPDFNGKLASPVSPFVVANSAPISTAVYLLPGPGQDGCLDTLVRAALTRMHPNEAQCALAFLSCASPSLTLSNTDKAIVRSMLSMINTRSPACPLSRLFRQYPSVVPTTSLEFDDLRNKISGWVI